MDYKAPDPSTVIYKYFFKILEGRRLTNFCIILGNCMRRITPAVENRWAIPILPLWDKLNTLIYIIGVFFCFVLTAILCAISGTLIQAQNAPDTISFFSDKWNICFYIIICPLYITFCVRLIFIVLEESFAEASPKLGEPLLRKQPASNRMIFSLAAIFLLSSLLITNYISDALSITKTYWFLSETSGVRTLNEVGFYYIVLNFSLLFITFLGGASYISVSMDGMQLAKNLVASPAILDFSAYRARLDRLIRAYYFAAFLVILYGLNILIWKWSPLGENSNINIAGAVYTIIGLFFVAIPRRFIQHLWAEYSAKKAAVTEEILKNENHYHDVDDLEANYIINLGHALFMSGWIIKFYELENIEVLEILNKVFEQ